MCWPGGPTTVAPPKTAIGVRVREVFFHCPASFQRAELWEPESWDAEASFIEFIRAACLATSGRPGPPSDDDSRFDLQVGLNP